MKHVRATAFAVLLGLAAAPAVAENQALTLPLNEASVVRPHNVTVQAVRHHGSEALEVRLTGPYRGPDTDTFAFVPGVDFHDGTIEVDVAGAVLPDAPKTRCAATMPPSISRFQGMILTDCAVKRRPSMRRIPTSSLTHGRICGSTCR